MLRDAFEKCTTHDLRGRDGLQLGQGVPERLERRENEKHEGEAKKPSKNGIGILALEGTKISATGR